MIIARAAASNPGGPNLIILSATPGPSATITTYSGYIVFKFNATGTLNVGQGTPGTADVLVVGGGSTGASVSGTSPGGAGGNGGLRTVSPAVPITSNTPIPVVVGSTATASSFGPVTSSGGTAGGAGGAGGNTGGPNFSGLPGGNGPSNDYETGVSQSYGGGGGGGGIDYPLPNPFVGGAGGSSGGGPGGPGRQSRPNPQGGPVAGSPGTPGTANTGGGGGGAGGVNSGTYTGGTGGSGVVIVRFPDTQFGT